MTGAPDLFSGWEPAFEFDLHADSRDSRRTLAWIAVVVLTALVAAGIAFLAFDRPALSQPHPILPAEQHNP